MGSGLSASTRRRAEWAERLLDTGCPGGTRPQSRGTVEPTHRLRRPPFRIAAGGFIGDDPRPFDTEDCRVKPMAPWKQNHDKAVQIHRGVIRWIAGRPAGRLTPFATRQG